MSHSLYSQEFPTLNVDEHFFLREQTTQDTQAFFEYYTDPEVARHILATNPKTIAEAGTEVQYCRNLFRYKRGIYWTLARKEDDRMIGAIGLYVNNQHYRAEICYDLARPYWNRGVMTRAIQVILDFCFTRTNIKRIEAITLKENLASLALLKKLNFHYEGHLKNYRYFNGKSHDIEMFAITPDMMMQQAPKEENAELVKIPT